MGNAKAGGPGAVIGALLILASLLTGAVAVVVMIAKDPGGACLNGSRSTPEQQAAIRQAEKAAAWGAVTVGAVALHEHNRHARKRQAAEWQAREAAAKARNARLRRPAAASGAA